MAPANNSNSRRIRLIGGTVGLIAVAALAAFFVLRQPSNEAADRNYVLTNPQIGTVEATVNASGTIEPREIVNLSFQAGGAVAEIAVQVGDRVQAGQLLARLDGRDAQFRVDQARAQLNQALANQQRVRGGASAAEVAAAEAQLAQARAQLRQTQGSVTAQDLTAARAQVDQARAALESLTAGPRSTERDQAQAQVDQARANLQTQRDSLAAAKVRAESQLSQAANTLRDRQAEYQRVYWDNREREQQLDRFGQELPQEALDAELAALRAVENAEGALAQAQLAAEQARQNEISGIAAAEAQVRNVEAGLSRVESGADSDQIAAARAQLAQAEANLSKLLGDQRGGALAAAEAAVASAEANLERVSGPGGEADLATAQAQVDSAAAGLAQAELAFELTSLRAPIDAVVAEMNLVVGETLSAARPAVVLADLSSYRVDVTIDELDVADVAVGQSVLLLLDALPDLSLRGVVERINPLAVAGAAVTSYNVRITLEDPTAEVRAGMSAGADIVVATGTDVLLVPRRAVRSDNGQFVIDVVTDAGLCRADEASWPADPPRTARPVELGLSNEQVIEIVGDSLTVDECVYVPGVQSRLSLFGGPPPGVRNR
jgi:HlyD family secretion protein